MDADLCVIGGGDAGFVAAMAGAALGLKVIVIDPVRVDPCWRNWDVVLATLRQAARAADTMAGGPHNAVAWFRTELRSALGRAAPDRRFARLAAMNVRVVRGRARFADPDRLEVDGSVLRARRTILATGSAADDDANRLLAAMLGPGPLSGPVTIGTADPRGVALAQGLQRLGCQVNMPAGLLPDWDPELVDPLRRALVRDGVHLDEAPGTADGVIEDGDRLRLDRGGIVQHGGRLVLSPALRTTNRRVHAIGSCAGARSSAHTQAQVAVVLKSAFFRLPARFDACGIPTCVMTDPAIAVVGRPETAISQATVWRWPFAETAAGSAAGGPSGFLKVIVDGRGRVAGAGIVHFDAAELVAFWSLAVQTRQHLARIAEVPLPAPAFADAFRRVATLAALRRLQSPWLKRVLTALNRLP